MSNTPLAETFTRARGVRAEITIGRPGVDGPSTATGSGYEDLGSSWLLSLVERFRSSSNRSPSSRRSGPIDLSGARSRSTPTSYSSQCAGVDCACMGPCVCVGPSTCAWRRPRDSIAPARRADLGPEHFCRAPRRRHQARVVGNPARDQRHSKLSRGNQASSIHAARPLESSTHCASNPFGRQVDGRVGVAAEVIERKRA